MAGRAQMQPEDTVILEGVYLLDSLDVPVPARAPLNIHSTIRKSSSMQGLNPAFAFASRLHALTGRDILLVVNARGGSSLSQWLKGAQRQSFSERSDDLQGRFGPLIPSFYDEAVRRCRAAMEYGTLRAILWHQGESDATEQKAAVYLERLSAFADDLREDLDAPEVPFVVGETNPLMESSAIINPVLRQVPDVIPHSACVSAEGCGVNDDNLHFNRDGQILLGSRYADAVLDFLDL